MADLALYADRIRGLVEDRASPVLVTARVLIAPSDLSDELRVVVPSFADDAVFEIRYWMPRGTDIPSADDLALVAFDETGEPWLIAWVPGASGSGSGS